jgi:23S rRNA pseudouridine1911/1915/1917 synthase
MQKPDIIYEDEELIVCCKPAGIATQTKRLGQPDMESLLRNHIAAQPRKEGRSGIPYVGIVHRLDQPVEGVMVFAKTPQSAAALSAQVQDRSFGKKYYALVDLPQGATFASATGKPGQGSLCDWILFSPRENRSSIVPANTGGARKASLDYSVLAQQEDQALLGSCACAPIFSVSNIHGMAAQWPTPSRPAMKKSAGFYNCSQQIRNLDKVGKLA